jgi:hypothetical protein
VLDTEPVGNNTANLPHPVNFRSLPNLFSITLLNNGVGSVLSVLCHCGLPPHLKILNILYTYDIWLLRRSTRPLQEIESLIKDQLGDDDNVLSGLYRRGTLGCLRKINIWLLASPSTEEDAGLLKTRLSDWLPFSSTMPGVELTARTGCLWEEDKILKGLSIVVA